MSSKNKILKLLELLFCLSFSCTLFTSCENPIADILLRTYSDPFDQAPVVDSFSERKKIFISWDKDEGADDYILMRAEDAFSPQFAEIYRGRQLNYKDEKINEGTRYLYRLDKTRGKRTFISEKKGYGYCASRINDTLKNNFKKDAVEILSDRTNMVLYYGRFCDGTEIFEEDYFYVNIPPQMQAEIVLTQQNPSSSSGRYIEYVDDGCPAVPFPTQSVKFRNSDTVWQKRIFSLSLDKSCVLSEGVYMVTYDIALAHISKLQ
ncbi:MAG: hypothetical protein K6E69_08405 [Treponema sp.]|uniref:hypothetical protein n=1 Tax=Treponema sp. TaxID=166 RepID=UPI00298DFBA0|nr:hypothetical protein [Treponema sp.]MCR5387128.1 hypothetical protein [Treponema sp.]